MTVEPYIAVEFTVFGERRAVSTRQIAKPMDAYPTFTFLDPL